MNAGQEARRREMYTQLFDLLADETRRRIIRVLQGNSGPISEQRLAERLAAMESDSGKTKSETAETLSVRLYHVHLPKLAESELIEWDRTAQTVFRSDYPLDEIHRFEERISTNGWGSIASALADGRRRRALAILEARDEPITREELADELASREASGQRAEPLIEKISLQLHNHYLPKLEEVDLVRYDPDESTVEYRGPSTLTRVLPESVSSS